MKELIERLRDSSARHDKEADRLCKEAADALQTLQAENERLKEEAKQWQSLSELSLGMAEAHSKERDALAAKLVPLEADAERLDYLQQGVTVELVYEGLAPRFRVGGHNSGTNSNLRAVIDAAKGGQQ